MLRLLEIYWRPLRAPPAAACLFAMAISCLADWLENRPFHSAITVPFISDSGVAFLLEEVGVIHINTLLVWRFLLVGIGLEFRLELHPFRFQPKG
jgi:hypothetical protein